MGGLVPASVSGIILCGGLSRRMGRDKAWLPWNGATLLSHAVDLLRPVVQEVIVAARADQDLPATDAFVVRDRIPGAGALGGLEAGLAAMRTPYGIAMACDMPWLNVSLLEAMTRMAPAYDLVIPQVSGKYQPLHAVYAKGLQPLVAGLLAQGERRVYALVSRVHARVLDEAFLGTYDPLFRSVRSLDDWKSYQEAIT